MNDSRDIKHEENLQAFDRLERRIEALTQGIGRTVQEHDSDIAVLKDNMSSIKNILWGIFFSSIGILSMSFYKLVLKGAG